MINTVSIVVIAIGVFFDLLGCVGLVRLPDVYNRLQAATKCVTLGTCLILFGVFLNFGFDATGVMSLLAALFVLITSPTGSHALARGSHKSGVPLCKESVVDKYAEDLGVINVDEEVR
jgi:multicomponent Na+:H+ antiporter subunit G